jgi:hypothetical protein
LEQGQQSGRTGIEVNAILGVNAIYVPTIRLSNIRLRTTIALSLSLKAPGAPTVKLIRAAIARSEALLAKG